MKLKFKKKSQLSIFILIATIVIFLFIFLFATNFEDKKLELEKSKTQILSETNNKLFPLKNNVDYCLEKQVKKALIISGMHGGYIYDRGEYYSQGIILSEMYPSKLIKNLDLNWNKLTDNVLIYSHREVYVPKINFSARNSTSSTYSRSIKEDYEKYILDEFLKCINLDKYKSAGYKIIQEEYITNIKTTNGPKTATINKIIGEINDKISININGITYFGKIKNINIEQKTMEVKFNENIFNNPNGIDYTLLRVKNLNSTIKVNVDFNSESISTQLFFPILIQKGDFSTSYKQSSVDVNVRFKQYLILAQYLLSGKSENKSLDYSNNTDLIKVINKSVYFRKTFMNNYKIIKTKIIDGDEFKRYVYSIVDNDSKIFGNPYIFNFAYENSAPIIDLSKITGSNSYFENNSVMLIVAKNSPYNKNIKTLAIDNQWGEKFYFIPKSESTATYDYSLTSAGDLSFTAKTKSRFVFDIELTDGEAIRKQQFVFVSGFLTNANNSDAKDCFSFKNYETVSLPISSTYKNKIYSFVDSTGKTRVFAYALNGKASKVKIYPSCLGISGTYSLEISYENLDGIDPSHSINNFDSNNEITIPRSNNPQLVKIGMVDISTGRQVNAGPFELEIYPAQCLGPEEFDTTKQVIAGGTGTCCDFSQLPTTTFPSSLNNLISNLKSSGTVIDVDSYFTFNPSSTVFTSSSFDYKNKILWTDLGAKATSIFEGKLKATCQGSKPRFEENIEDITSSPQDFSDRTKEIFISEKFMLNKNIKLKEAQQSNECEFAQLEDYSDLEILTNTGRVFSVGFKSLNPSLSTYIKSIPGGSTYDNTMVKCSNDWYEKTSSSTSWAISTLPTSALPSTSEFSQGYCQQGSATCSGRSNSNNPTWVEKDSICKDYYIDSSGNAQSQKNSGWICGTYNKVTSCDTSTTPSTPVTTSTDLICDGTSYSCPTGLQNIICT